MNSKKDGIIFKIYVILMERYISAGNGREREHIHYSSSRCDLLKNNFSER